MHFSHVVDPRPWCSGQCYPAGPLLAPQCSQSRAFQERFLWAEEQQQQQQLASSLAYTPISWNACPCCGVWHFPNKCHATAQNIPSQLVVVREVFYTNEVWVLVRYSCGTESIEEWGSASLPPEDAKSFGRALKDANDNAVKNVLGRIAQRNSYTTGSSSAASTCSSSPQSSCVVFPNTHTPPPAYTVFPQTHPSGSFNSQTPPTPKISSVAGPPSPAVSSDSHIQLPPEEDTSLTATRQPAPEPQKASAAEDSDGISSAPRKARFCRSVTLKYSNGDVEGGALATVSEEKSLKTVRRSKSIANAVSSRSLYASGDPSLYQSCPAMSLQLLPDSDLSVEDIAFQSVLVVDDDLINIKSLSRVFAKKGLDITTGEDGLDLIELCIRQGKHFDMILVDENMRHMNGSAAVMELRRHEKEQGLQPMQIIVTSGNTSPEDLARYYSSGVNGFVSKPLNMRAILKATNDYFKYITTASSMEGDSLNGQGTESSDLHDSDDSQIAYSTKDTAGFLGNLVFGELEIFGRARE